MLSNKNGWGLRVMLILSGVLVLFLAIAIFYIYVLYDSMNKEVSVSYYYELEDNLESQALIYLNDYYNDTLTNEELTITRNVLRTYDLDISLIDHKGNACSGYVVASKSKGIINTNGFISCKNYQTKGYEEWKK